MNVCVYDAHIYIYFMSFSVGLEFQGTMFTPTYKTIFLPKTIHNILRKKYEVFLTALVSSACR